MSTVLCFYRFCAWWLCEKPTATQIRRFSQKGRAGFQNWILWDTAALQGQRAMKAWRNYSRILDMCISNWNVEMKDVIQVPLNEIFHFVLLPQLNPRWRMKLTLWLFMERANLQKCLFCFCVTAKYSARTLLHSDLRWKKIMLIESLGRHEDFLGNNCLQPSRNCVEML